VPTEPFAPSRTSEAAALASADRRPEEQQLLLDAALSVLRDGGVAGFTVADVLAEANLGTRAFYRHFKSKDQLVVSVFASTARQEATRLATLMEGRVDPVAAVVAWIEGRLDLAFDDGVESDLRYVSREAQALYAVEPELLASVYDAMLRPLVDELRRGAAGGYFVAGDPVSDAHAIQAVVWSRVEEQWATSRGTYPEVREQTVGFCLRAVGASHERIGEAIRG
jgi:AcrR family transcriptional regulator